MNIRSKSILILTMATVAIVAVGGGVYLPTALASGSGTNVEATTVSLNGETFFTRAGVDRNWSRIAANYPEPLPQGVHFPDRPPGFFEQGTSEGLPLFELSLPESILSRFWRCAWLDSELSAIASGRATDAAAAASEMDVNVHIGQDVTVASYEVDLDEAAAKQSADPRELEFATECEVYKQEGHQR